MTDKLDLYADNKADYAAPRKAPVLIETSPASYLTIDGRGEPGSETFQSGIGALYAAAYTIKMTSKQAGRDYKVCKLEALWWANGARVFSETPRDQWCWKMMIRTPDFITDNELEVAARVLLGKGKAPEVGDVRLERIDEGRCVQMLHVGPYEDEPETIERMREAAAAEGLEFRGRHHEVYLSDPRRVEPARLRTILRQPVE